VQEETIETAQLFFFIQSKNNPVTNDIPERSDLISGLYYMNLDGSNIRIYREV